MEALNKPFYFYLSQQDAFSANHIFGLWLHSIKSWAFGAFVSERITHFALQLNGLRSLEYLLPFFPQSQPKAEAFHQQASFFLLSPQVLLAPLAPWLYTVLPSGGHMWSLSVLSEELIPAQNVRDWWSDSRIHFS